MAPKWHLSGTFKTPKFDPNNQFKPNFRPLLLPTPPSSVLVLPVVGEWHLPMNIGPKLGTLPSAWDLEA